MAPTPQAHNLLGKLGRLDFDMFPLLSTDLLYMDLHHLQLGLLHLFHVSLFLLHMSQGNHSKVATHLAHSFEDMRFLCRSLHANKGYCHFGHIRHHFSPPPTQSAFDIFVLIHK